MRRLNLKHCLAVLALFLLAPMARAQTDDVTRRLAHDTFKQLIEINTTDSVGSTTVAAEAMARRLRDAGFPAADVVVLGPNDRKGNMVARLHGTGVHKPVLLIGHLDVVEARREDWTTDPFQFVEQDGYYYGRGTQDMKSGDAIWVTTLIRFKREGYEPDRDLILALTADEEGGQSNGVDWLLKNHRDLVDAEFVLNADGGGVDTVKGKPLIVEMDATEKLYADYQLTVTNPGGHSSLPVPDNAIYHLADGLGRVERYQFPFELNAVTRAFFDRTAGVESGQTCGRHARNRQEPARRSGHRAPLRRPAVECDHAHHLRGHPARCRPRQQRPATDGARQRQLPHPPRTLARRSTADAHQGPCRSQDRSQLRHYQRPDAGQGGQRQGATAGFAAARRDADARSRRRRDVAGSARGPHHVHRRVRRCLHQRGGHADLRNLRLGDRYG